MPAPYPNDGPVEIAMTVARGPAKYRLVHRMLQPSASDWNRYFEQSAVARREKRQMIIEDRSAPAGIAIWDRCAQSVEGYTAGGRPLGDLPDWRARVPAAHKLKALEMLGEVEPAAAQEPDPTGGFDLGDGREAALQLRVRLGAQAWTVAHRLRPPDAAQLRRFESARALRRITANGEAVGSGWLAAACELYDALAVGVEGYAIADPKAVPPLHKKAAVDLLTGTQARWAAEGEEDDAGWEKN